MSDRSENLSKEYVRRVVEDEQSRSIGLFPIPEYPELEADRGMWSAALDIILTTLRYLAPATLLTLFWSQQSFLFKILKHIDSALRAKFAVIFSSEEQKKDVLQWLAEAGPVTVEHLDTVWRHGWILCGVLDAKLPGACAGHSPTRLSLKHAQAIAEQYLGVEPIFSRQELESNDSLSRHQEWKLATYLDRIREALNKLTPPVSKPNTQRTCPEITQFTLDYVAGGSGLSAAQINNKMFFKIYPTAQQCIDPGEITILIRGPKDTYGMTVIPPVLGKAQLIRQKLLGLQPRLQYTETSLPITQGATYLRNYGRNDMNKTYFIPKATYDIKIDVESKPDYAKVGYTVPLEGKYEISITSKGMNIVNSPYTVKASKDIIRILERQNSNCENGEEIDIVDVETNRKVVLRIVDFVTEKMLLRENGSLEKISDDEATVLMSSRAKENTLSVPELKIEMYGDDSAPITKDNINTKKSNKFKMVVNNVMRMIRVCTILKDFGEKQLKVSRETTTRIETYSNDNMQQDIVNETLGNESEQTFILQDKRDKFIIPRSIYVSIRTEKPKTYFDQQTIDTAITEITSSNSNESPDNLQQYSILQEKETENNGFIDVATTSSNPFQDEVYDQNYTTQKQLGVFVSTEYETNKSQNEEMQPVKIIVDGIPLNDSESPQNDPFIIPPHLERPKTPVLKIISGEIDSRKTPVYVDPKLEELIEKEIEDGSFLNPHYVHEHCKSSETGEPITDFIIGAPVSLPPNIAVTSSDPVLESITNMDAENSSSVYLAPLHTIRKDTDNEKINTTSLNIQLQDSETKSKGEFNTTNTSAFIEVVAPKKDTMPKKDTWDSAYVSIDDNIFPPDGNNNNDNISYGTQHKHISHREGTFEISRDDLSSMGPAEIEIWNCELNNLQDDVKATKKEFKIFSPIYEESERNTSIGVKDSTKTLTSESLEDQVTVAFAELNTIYQEIFPIEHSSIETLDDDVIKLHNKEIQYFMENNDKRVNSASEVTSDVKRYANEFEGEISVVQANVTESDSVSRTLQDDKDDSTFRCDIKSTVEIKFGDKSNTNLVQERKQYYDEQSSETEITLAENKAHYKKKRLSSKNLKHNDSLTKRKGKQIVKNLLQATEDGKERQIKKMYPLTPQVSRESDSEVNLVEKWKQYWDTKLQMESEISKSTNKILKSKPPTKKENILPLQKDFNDEIVQVTRDIQTYKAPMKQELPEEVYKAFETSPKTFFGTSRKQILNKIDSFSGKPNTVNKSISDVSTVFPDSGLVSSRVSLFHNISKEVDDRLWHQTKSQSMHNIYERKDIDTKSAVLGEEIDKTNEQVHEHLKCEMEYIERLNLEKNNDLPERDKESHDVKYNKECTEKNNKISVREKRNLFMQKFHNKSFDEGTLNSCKPLKELDAEKHRYVKRILKERDDPKHSHRKYSKSEMDIFNKVTKKDSIFKVNDNLDVYKSYEDLPKINVKNFISLYENVTKTTAEPKPVKRMSSTRTNSTCSPKHFEVISSTSEADNKPDITHHATASDDAVIRTQNMYHAILSDAPDLTPKTQERHTPDLIKTAKTRVDSSNAGYNSDHNQDTYLSLSDIDLEIVERVESKSVENSPERELERSNADYKSRFKMAKQFFQSLEELRDVKKPPKLNECQKLLYQNKSTESPEEKEETKSKKRFKQIKKSNSMPSSEMCRIWNQLQESQQGTSNDSKYVKISEKFNVDDLFTDVMEGKLSRQGSLRGIPHKKAVLETFRSMENVFDKSKLSPYKTAVTQLNYFTEENKNKNSQSYLTEYPYLPTTDPSKYHSRSDATASGLISMKEVLKRKPRRNSVPDIRLNPSFNVDL